MGTRADFYVGRGPEARWLGSIAFDGYPTAKALLEVIGATTEDEFVAAVAERLKKDDASSPEHGWPWPWTDSAMTDYAYAVFDGHVWMSRFGRAWVVASPEEPDPWPETPRAELPDMTNVQKVTYGKRSGLVILGLGVFS